MSAEGILANPLIFAQARALAAGPPPQPRDAPARGRLEGTEDAASASAAAAAAAAASAGLRGAAEEYLRLAAECGTDLDTQRQHLTHMFGARSAAAPARAESRRRRRAAAGAVRSFRRPTYLYPSPF